jgi:cytochrome c-type biogenesis protein CcmH
MILAVIILVSLALAAILFWPRRTQPVPTTYVAASIGVLALALVGYTYAGAPALPAQPAQRETAPPQPTATLDTLRAQLLNDPGNISLWLQLAEALQESGNSDAALEAMAVASAAMPISADLWVMRGQLLVQRSNGEITPAARFAFDRAAEIDPKHPAPRYMLALAWVMQGKPQEAKPILEALVTDTPTDVPYRANIDRLLRGVTAMVAAGVGSETAPLPQ